MNVLGIRACTRLQNYTIGASPLCIRIRISKSNIPVLGRNCTNHHAKFITESKAARCTDIMEQIDNEMIRNGCVDNIPVFGPACLLKLYLSTSLYHWSAISCPSYTNITNNIALGDFYADFFFEILISFHRLIANFLYFCCLLCRPIVFYSSVHLYIV